MPYDLPSIPDTIRLSYFLAKSNFGESWKLAGYRYVLPLLVVAVLCYLTTSVPLLCGLIAVIGLVVWVILAIPAFGGLIELALAAVQERDRRFITGYGWTIAGVGILVGILQLIVTAPFDYFKIPYASTGIKLYCFARFYLLSIQIVAEGDGPEAIKTTWKLSKGRVGYLLKCGLLILLPGIPAIAVILVAYYVASHSTLKTLNDLRQITQYWYLLFLSFIPIILYLTLFDPFYRAVIYQSMIDARDGATFDEELLLPEPPPDDSTQPAGGNP